MRKKTTVRAWMRLDFQTLRDNYDPATWMMVRASSVVAMIEKAAFNYQEGVNNPTNEDCYYTFAQLGHQRNPLQPMQFTG